MHSEITRKERQRHRRALRVRSKLHGTIVKPRLSVFKSNKHLAVQLIDDDAGVTLASASTYAKDKRGTEYGSRSKVAAEKLGEEIAALAKEHQIKDVVFDRGPYKYHGVLATLADAVRAAGIHL